MADKKYMPQEKSRPSTKPGSQDITKSGFEAASEGRSGVGFPKAYQDDFSRPVITYTDGNTLHDSATDGGYVTKTETTVEYSRVPMGTIHGNYFPTLTPLHKQPPKIDEYISNVKREETRSYNTGSPRNLYWWCIPNSNGNGGQADSGQPNNTGLSTYYKPSDADMRQQHIHNHLHRNEKAPEGKQEPIVNSTDEWHRSNHLGHKGIPHAKPANTMDTATGYLKDAKAILVPAQGYVPASMGAKAEVLPAIDSREAVRIYGGLPTSDVKTYTPANTMDTATGYLKDAKAILVPAQGYVPAPVGTKAEVLPALDSREAARIYGGLSTSDVKAYTPAIDSNEAAWKYRGQIL